MKSLRLSVYILALVLTGKLDAASYVVLQGSADHSLVRVSADGKSVTTIARGVEGVSLTVDGEGNFLVVSHSTLSRVTPGGEVTALAHAPEGSIWVSVAVDRSGAILIADGMLPAVWKLSANGSFIKKLKYDGVTLGPGGYRRASLLMGAGNDCMLLIQGIGVGLASVAQFFRIQPDGTVSEIPIKGPKTMYPDALTSDGSGNYFFVNEMNDGLPTQAIMQLSADGTVQKFADVPFGGAPVRMARNPETGELAVSNEFPERLLLVRPDGFAVTTLAERPRVTQPVAVIEVP